MERDEAFKLYCEIMRLISERVAGEVSGSTHEGLRVKVSIKIEPGLFLVPGDEEAMADG